MFKKKTEKNESYHFFSSIKLMYFSIIVNRIILKNKVFLSLAASG